MLRKQSAFRAIGLAITISASLISCQGDCIDYIDFKVLEIQVSVNSENRGILSVDPQNSNDTVRSHTNQFLIDPEVALLGHTWTKRPGVGLISTAYAIGDCPEVERSQTNFDRDKIVLTLDVAYDAGFAGGGLVPAGTNLMEVPELLDPYLKVLRNDPALLSGFDTPFGFDKAFFGPLQGKRVVFTFEFEDQEGTGYSDSFSAYIDIPG